jgi:AraC-like DNA-binding protein
MKVEHALHMMRAYLEDCAEESAEASNRRTEELNGAIRACVERLAVDRRDDDRVHAPRLPLNALEHAIRYVDEHLDAKLKWDDIASQLGMDALPFGRGTKDSIGLARHIIRSRLRGAVKLLRDDTISLAQIALQLGWGCQRRLTGFCRARARSFAPLARAGRIAAGVLACLVAACATDRALMPIPVLYGPNAQATFLRKPAARSFRRHSISVRSPTVRPHKTQVIRRTRPDAAPDRIRIGDGRVRSRPHA